MKVSKSVAVASATAIIGLTSLGGAAMVGAADSTSKNDPMSSLVQAIAKKFNLNQNDVQQVFTDQHQQMETQRATEAKTRLDQAVTDGKITKEQEDKIIAKQAEMKTAMEANRTNMQSLTDAERKTAMEKERTDLQQWAKDNNIPEEYLRFGMRGPGGHAGHPGGMPAASQSTSTLSN